MLQFVVFFALLLNRPVLAGIYPLAMSFKETSSKSQNISEIKKNGVESLTAEQREKLKNPEQTFRTFIQAMEKVKNGSGNAFNEAILTLDLSQIDPNARQVMGRMTAERLINTLDRIAKINFTHVPTNEIGPKWFFRKQTVNIGDNVFDVEIAISKTEDGVWKFTEETVSSIENFYKSVSHLKVVEGVT